MDNPSQNELELSIGLAPVPEILDLPQRRGRNINWRKVTGIFYS